MSNYQQKIIIWSVVLGLNLPLGAQQKMAEQDESFDPTQLHEPSIPILDGSMIYDIITDIDVPAAERSIRRDTVRVTEKMGWKVQLYSTTDYYKADTVYQQAQDEFLGVDVVKVFNSPYYKIRVGNCTTRDEAELLLDQALDLKYRDAWIIRTTVKAQEQIINY